MSALKDQAPTATLDVTGKTIPYPLYLTRKAMRQLESGAILKVVCNSAESAEYSIPRYAEKMGYHFETVKLPDRWEIYIRKV
jgi:TusA-related sulfurtransferase